MPPITCVKEESADLISLVNIRKTLIAGLLFSASILFTYSADALAFSGDDKIDFILGALLSDDHRVSYKAEEVVVSFSGGRPEVNRYKIGILKPDKMRKDSFEIDGKIRDVLVQDSELSIVYNPDQKVVIRSERDKVDTTDVSSKAHLSLLRKNYEVIIKDHEEMVGRRAIVVSILPRLKGSRPSFKIWMDHQTFLPLKTEMYNVDESLSYMSTITDIVFNPSFPKNYFVIMVPHGTRAYEQEASGAKNASSPAPVKPGSGHLTAIAGGYVLKEAIEGDGGYSQLVYHDGLNSISVFKELWDNSPIISEDLHEADTINRIEKVKLDHIEGYFCHRGSQKLLIFTSKDFKHTIVGEVSRDILVDIATQLHSTYLRK